ncbi:TetR family transcriptional regulator C-terminal domain-containing protein [Paenibacillus pasadenensis]|uniref:TetR/AcrR family transcriptional regulator n=1 Tax=Paenibacillus pasadenensis TaxID=217090 RepID=UPI002042144E|nr:TetR/AcrR family transcriptional regulator C-terminal domain-containing protein [Paenibacillus pasadenensis]MCM3747211.1 TetR family transcriptional regulator C-terminal domain-containing protein [Paenibacillus pasadenensis]
MKEDVRVYKTKKNIADAFIHLLGEKDFICITVKEICAFSLTSKSTFYSHYIDKYDLLEKLVRQHADSFKTGAMMRFQSIKQGNVNGVFEKILDQITEDKAVISALLDVHISSADFQVELESILYQTCLSFLEKESASQETSLDYLARMYAANSMVMIRWTLKNGKDKQAVNLVHQIQEFIFQDLLMIKS